MRAGDDPRVTFLGGAPSLPYPSSRSGRFDASSRKRNPSFPNGNISLIHRPPRGNLPDGDNCQRGVLPATGPSDRRRHRREFLLIRRYDRLGEAPTTRLHQEDFCQALGIPTAQKYQPEGGPSLARCFALLREATDVPAFEISKLLDAVALSFVVGNHDAHGKNFSLLYRPEHPKPVLAPLYDLVSTFAYHRSHNLSRKMAMSIGGEYRPEHVHQRHLDRLLEEAGLGGAPSRRRLRALAERAPRAADDLRRQFIHDGWDSSTIELIVEIVTRRSRQLREIAAPAPKRGG